MTCACAGAAGLAAASPAAPARDGLPQIEVFQPAGAARGSILVVHGGGWRDVGGAKLARVRPWAERFRSWGYEVWSTTYRPGRRSLADVLRVYDAFAASAPAGRPACLYGQSAGGHLALMVAARRRSVAGVISAAGPTHLPSLPRHTRSLATEAFGSELGRFSPLLRAGRIRSPLLLEYGRYDRLVPFAQGRAMAAAVAGETPVEVRGRPSRADGSAPPDMVPWVHGWVTPEVARSVRARERSWLAANCSRTVS